MRPLSTSLSLPATAAASAAPLAALALGASFSAALTAGAVVALCGSGLAAVFARDRSPLGARVLAGSGLFVSGLAAAIPMLPGAPPALQPAVLLAGALAVVAGLGRLEASRVRAQQEAEALQVTLSRREGDVRAQAERIRKLDQWDVASGLLNRRGFLVAAAENLHDCAAAAEPLVLLLVEAGEPVAGGQAAEIKRVARAVRRATRGSDLAARLDGGRLALLLPRCKDPRPALDRLVAGLAGTPRLAGVSVGPRGPWPDAEGLLASAEAALAASERAPSAAGPAIWPIDWGLAVPAGGTAPVPR